MLQEEGNKWRGYIRKAGMIGLMLLLILPHMLMNPVSEVFADEADYDILDVGGTITIVKYLGTDTDVNIPEQIQGKDVTAIADQAFMGLKLDKVTIPGTVTTIGMGAFMGCELDAVILNEGLIEIGLMAFAGNEMENVDIPGTVTTIAEGAFSQGSLKTVTLREGLKTIKDKAFWDNEIRSVHIPEGVEVIGEEAFIDNKLEEATLPGTIISIGKKAFIGEDGKNNIRTLTLQAGLSSIGESAFKDNLLESVRIPGSVSVIEKEAFMGNVLEAVILDEGVEEIGEHAFAQNKLEEVVIPSTVNLIATSAFFQNEITTLTLPNSVRTIGDASFAFNPLIEIRVYNDELVFGMFPFFQAPPATPGDITLFGHSGSTTEQYAIAIGYTFQILEDSGSTDCGENTDFSCVINENDTITITGYTGSDTDVLIPDTIDGKAVTIIGEDAFTGKQLIAVEIPYGVTSIEKQAFSANDLTSVTIISYNASIEGSAFEGNQTNPADLTLYGCFGSAAETHANDKGYSFQESSKAECLEMILTPSETNPTNQDITISVSVNKLQESIRELKWAEGSKDLVDFQAGDGDGVTDNRFTVSENGTYTVYVKDKKGNEKIERIGINNIDKSLLIIQVQIGDGETITLHAYGSDSIQQLKQKIHDTAGIATEKQKISFGGNVLEDGRTLADYNILNQTTLQLVVLSTDASPDPVWGVYIPSSDISLDRFEAIVDGENRLPFDRAQFEYDLGDTEAETVEIIVKTHHPMAKIALDGEAFADKKTWHLNEGKNMIDIVIFAENGDEKTYSITVNRLAKVPFTDIAGHWAESYIKKTYWERLFYGYSDQSFRPDEPISRMEVTSLFVRLLELDEQKQVPFSDVQSIGKDSMEELEKAYAIGMVKGYPDQTFNPFADVSRAHLALIFYRTYDKVNGTPYEPRQLAYFSDTAGYDQETQNAIAMLVEIKIAEGSDGNFRPDDQATRAQAAKMFVKFKEVLGRLENK
ncbi:leucine-rich repeat protein [Paenibacillus sp. PAMC21692]|uniref:leucine-rich repeat protein n=1 Tax=Paenibacillus sp. PAMC21692 TaxID=2762320 RepID=UPI00164E5F6D|nr:leucine-rich repeat protein [Paenibacillus sp. PAMC21692]QNK60334.1 leucine-rich repeat protein [Paenibacillus sp. PAMC21692]